MSALPLDVSVGPCVACHYSVPSLPHSSAPDAAQPHVKLYSHPLCHHAACAQCWMRQWHFDVRHQVDRAWSPQLLIRLFCGVCVCVCVCVCVRPRNARRSMLHAVALATRNPTSAPGTWLRTPVPSARCAAPGSRIGRCCSWLAITRQVELCDVEMLPVLGVLTHPWPSAQRHLQSVAATAVADVLPHVHMCSEYLCPTVTMWNGLQTTVCAWSMCPCVCTCVLRAVVASCSHARAETRLHAARMSPLLE